jgi:hypothetical protein
MDRILHVIMIRLSAPLGKHHEEYTVGYGRTNVIGSRTSFVIATVRSSMYLEVIRSRPTTYSKATIQLNHLNMEKYNTKSKI